MIERDKEIRWNKIREILIYYAEKDDILEDHMNHIINLEMNDAQDYEIELEELVRWSKIKEILISSAVIFEDYVNHVLQLEKIMLRIMITRLI
jgi:hypothetical protein